MAFGDDRGNFQRQMYKGDWKCGMCGASITELPFEPNPSRIDQLKCKECWMKNKPPRRDSF